ncbi:hypothetical protein J6590_074800 [Homalodisca vitripennis]|nr:hypothetical protein J6590_074800 [Homalodisca vitripennis]
MVAQALDVNQANEDISIAHRLSRPTKNVLAPGIVIQFLSIYTRAVWLSAAKRKKIETTDLSPTLKQAPVYVNEHLTAHNRQLLGHAKTLVREKKLAYAWVSDGNILVRKTADSQALRDHEQLNLRITRHLMTLPRRMMARTQHLKAPYGRITQLNYS